MQDSLHHELTDHRSCIKQLTTMACNDSDSFFEAVQRLNPSEFKKLAKESCTDFINIKNSKNQTLLHHIAGYGLAELASFLISQGADVNAKDYEGTVPLHNSCSHGHYKTSRILIEAGAQVDLTDIEGWSALHYAVNRKDNWVKISPVYWKVIELLLDSGANPYLKSSSGRDCFSRIKDNEDRRVVRLMHLLGKLKLCQNVDEARIALVDKYLSISDFFELVKLGDENLEVLTVLITPRLINSQLESCDHITPLHRAAGYNHLEVAKLLTSNGAKVDAIDSFGRIPLHNAAQYGHVEMMKFLINQGSNINKQDLVGYSPLHVAASNRTFTACLTLVELGADVNTKCSEGKLPYDLAESDDVKEVLKPDGLRHTLEIIPSSSDRAIYVDIQTEAGQLQPEPLRYRQVPDELMLDSRSDARLFGSTNHSLKLITLDHRDWRFIEVKRRMLATIRVHSGEAGGRFTSYEIISIEQVLHEKVWSKYRLKCQGLEIDYGEGSQNEKLLFHGSTFVDKIQSQGFDERYAQSHGMFGAGIYFAEHSSKSNQYTFGLNQGCKEHNIKSCYICERKIILAQVALGRSLISKEAMPTCAHAPPGYNSVTGSPESTESLVYPEYVVYSGDQAYPLYVIKYRIVP